MRGFDVTESLTGWTWIRSGRNISESASPGSAPTGRTKRISGTAIAACSARSTILAATRNARALNPAVGLSSSPAPSVDAPASAVSANTWGTGQDDFIVRPVIFTR